MWSWDITYLHTEVRGAFYYLYMVLDVWNRKIVGFEVHEEESAEHAAGLIDRICDAEGIWRAQLSLHSDNGGPMKGATMLAKLQDLGVAPSFSRPSVSNDNPYSESLFRTAKYYLEAQARRPERWTQKTRDWSRTEVVTLNPAPALAREAKSYA